MGLAASQARLLTITSRISSIELKQQQIANSKILLANDSDEVSTKYSTALNNQKIQMKNGQDTVDVNYTTLTAQGYNVKRTSDGVVAKAGSTNSTSTTTTTASNTKPPVPTYLNTPEPPKPSMPRPTKVLPQPTIARPEKITYPQGATTTDIPYDEATGTPELDLIDKAMNTILGAVKNNADEEYLKDIINCIVDNCNNVALQARDIGLTQTAEAVDSIGKDWATLQDSFDGREFEKNIDYINDLATGHQNQIPDLEYGAQVEYENNHQTTNAPTQEQIEDYEDRLALSKQEWATYDDNHKANELWNQYDIKFAQYEADCKTDEQAKSDYEQKLANYNNGLANNTSSSTSTSVSPEQALYDQVKGMDGTSLSAAIISGYLAIVDSNGAQVSLASNTNFTTVYDKSDDAAAEAEYNASMAKINRKEKMLDNQMTKLDTEHSSLTQDAESVKTVIKDHASKDFQLFA